MTSSSVSRSITPLRPRRAHPTIRPRLSLCYEPPDSLQGFSQRRPLNRAKSVSVEYNTYPRSIARPAKWASVVRFPAIPRCSSAARAWRSEYSTAAQYEHAARSATHEVAP